MEMMLNSRNYKSASSEIESGIHPAVKQLVGYVYDYSDEPQNNIVHSGTLSMFRNSWFGGIALIGEMLIDDGLITSSHFYYRRLKYFMNKYQDTGRGLYSTKRTRAEVKRGKLLATLMLDHLYPSHIYFNPAQFAKRLHTVVT